MPQRELIRPHENDARCVRRADQGQFTDDQTAVGKSLAADRRTQSATVVPKGEGDREIGKSRSLPEL